MSTSRVTSLVSFTPMQASENHGTPGKSQYSHSLRDSMHLRESGTHFLPQNTLLSHDESQQKKLDSKFSTVRYCTLESSSAVADHIHSLQSNTSSSSASDSYSDHTYGSPICTSCISEDQNDLKYKLKELECVMLGPENVVDSFNAFNILMEIPRGDLKQALLACARALADNDITVAEWLMTELRQLVSVSGEPIQRLGAYLLEGLVARISSSGSAIYKALNCEEPASSELLSYMHILYEVCPYFKFGYMSANGAIAEAVKNEDRVHIIDFHIAQGSQWVTLIQALAARPGGPPHIRITGIDDSVSAYARGGGLHIVGQRLFHLAESCKVPFEFHSAAMSGCEVKLENLRICSGEALVVNFAFQLHHIPDESVSTTNHRDTLLRLVKSLSPKVVTLVEQESNTNTTAFYPRFAETLDYYTAIFESIDVTRPRENKERISVEQHCLARDIVNIIACEGAERVERHELHGKWKARLKMAGFAPFPLSPLVNSTIKSLLEKYNDKYTLEERDGALFLGWMNRDLVVSSAWR
ncbi:Chitin-inducible gibberellin-responsive protein 2 [Apostasia shenzhenica]|uniref:Chitin-inducible gibberellin-responsive protein 2 n=1 Tax=Apostasia shenzhenica TaxID=1088818 RepID=A0A2I0ARN4_9ASPA|nr:Chitin-inducible gibberellin-responsive protein 2 [Apostasia shenzhenica]